MTWECHAGSILGWKDGEVWRATGISYDTANRGHAPHAAIPSARLILAKLSAAEHHHAVKCSFQELAPGSGFGFTDVHTSGASDTPMYDPVALVREQGVIFVSTGYRLGLFGYLGGRGTQTPNLGLLARTAWLDIGNARDFLKIGRL